MSEATHGSRIGVRIRALVFGASIVTAACLAACAAPAEAIRVACAANFREAANEIGSAFQDHSGHAVSFSFGSTGQLYAQIALGAPFDVFLAADTAHVNKVVEEGLAIGESRLTYAAGRIVLFSSDENLIAGPETLTANSFSRLAIAEPSVAPYGAAALETMQALSAMDTIGDRVVRGLNVAQAYQFVQSGNADLGFVGLAQVVRHSEGSRWIVPSRLHRPILQDAVLLKQAAGKRGATAFLRFLVGQAAGEILNSYGYDRGE